MLQAAVSKILLVALCYACLPLPASAQAPPHLPPLDRSLPPRAEHIYEQLANRVDARVAMDVVTYIAPLWRLAGNPAFNQSQQLIFDRLAAAGMKPTYETFTNADGGWSYAKGTLRLGGPAGEVVLSRETHHIALAINSYSTVAGGVTAPLIDAGAGTSAASYEGKNVKGAAVLVSGPIGPAFAEAVHKRGAAGVISSDVARYTRPDDTPDVLQWGAIPKDEKLRSFGFKATPRAAQRLRDALAKGPVNVHVEIESTFHAGPDRTLAVDIPGSTHRDQRVVLAAHVQEPGANDNASGCGTLLAAALAMQDLVRRGVVAPPARTITFLWVDEIRGSEQWIKDHADLMKGVVAMLSLDMTGEDTSRTGGTFLIEKGPDPSAIWDRPSDPHSEWGASKVDPATVRGSFLNDLHLAVALRRARDTNWVVRTNPYEGGSDHTVFMQAGVPSLLNWHFTDRYYHSNLDTVDKVSATEMQNVAITVGTTALFVASADKSDSMAVRRLMDRARDARFATETKNHATPEILQAWRKWYDEAIASLARLQ